MIRLGSWLGRSKAPGACGGRAAPARCRSSGRPARALRVLVDMDGVLADFEGGFLKKFRARYPDTPYIALEDRRGFWVSEQYGRLQAELSIAVSKKDLSQDDQFAGDVLSVISQVDPWKTYWVYFHTEEKAISIWESKNFFIDLEPLPGAVEAVKEMAGLENTDVFICTSPIKKYEYCPNEKYAWVEKHFGQEFLEQIVLTRDKTVVSGDLLIDDRPDITGAEPNPSWEHILFTACHNRHLQLQPPNRRLHSWTDDWKAILDSKRFSQHRAFPP